MSDEIINKGLGRLAYQFKNSLNFKRFIQAFLEEYENINIANLQLLNDRYINTAYGIQLDKIGEIVGIDRPEDFVSIIGAFGFLTDPSARGFGTLSDYDIGGNFVKYGNTKEPVGDDIYRVAIRAKIIKNNISMIVDDTIDLISFMFNGINVRYMLYDNLKPIYDIGQILSPIEEVLLKNVPLLIGLDKISFRSHDEDYFSFSGDIDAKGFGKLSDPDVGGSFTKIIY